MLIPRVMTALVARLVAEGGIELAPGATQEALVAFLLDALQDQADFAHLGPFLSRTLIACPLVDELYLDDRQLVELVNDLAV